MSAATARSAARPSLRLSVLVVAGLVLAAAAAGLVVGGVVHGRPAAPAPAPAPATLAAAGVRLELPAGWARGKPIALPGFRRPLALHDTHAGVRAVAELLPATSATLLPTGLHASGAPATVGQAWRYRVAGTVVYAAPTTKGIATVGCVGVAGNRAERACRALAAAITVPGARRLAPGPRAALLIRLPATLAALDAARAKGARALAAAARPAAQAIAADRLARAHRTAAADLARFGDDDAVVADLAATANAYRTLANAARARTPRPYAEARRAVLAADRGLRAQLKRP